mmetsp:Transcript_3764/g.13442  ORF Transcript_3764/g.13442 Transcript_3764/m.13442 type:complete len:359 (+) Transcript_3764:604-1680(+)
MALTCAIGQTQPQGGALLAPRSVRCDASRLSTNSRCLSLASGAAGSRAAPCLAARKGLALGRCSGMRSCGVCDGGRRGVRRWASQLVVGMQVGVEHGALLARGPAGLPPPSFVLLRHSVVRCLIGAPRRQRPVGQSQAPAEQAAALAHQQSLHGAAKRRGAARGVEQRAVEQGAEEDEKQEQPAVVHRPRHLAHAAEQQHRIQPHEDRQRAREQAREGAAPIVEECSVRKAEVAGGAVLARGNDPGAAPLQRAHAGAERAIQPPQLREGLRGGRQQLLVRRQLLRPVLLHLPHLRLVRLQALGAQLREALANDVLLRVEREHVLLRAPRQLHGVLLGGLQYHRVPRVLLVPQRLQVAP